MASIWTPNTQYGHGDIAQYDGHEYKVTQPHLSQTDWTPPAAPHLWEKLKSDQSGN
ncbi:hypothetical protein GCM10009837_71030 [Streptomyces durmitorensis]|uniref:carbohydrate-binding protein n=1 Tax=Streptomyces durmitorensis TaxID=319947 RepID=UPI0033733CDC